MQFAAIHDTDQNAVLDVMMQGFASSKMLELMAPKMISEDFTPGMESRLHAKDMGIALAAAQKNGEKLPSTALISQLLNTVQEAGWQNMDTSILYRYLKNI
jgi:3-hydroxyisobutyrate dehydrogenase/2-hydroxy-3-oxopropionate reductase